MDKAQDKLKKKVKIRKKGLLGSVRKRNTQISSIMKQLEPTKPKKKKK